MTVDGGTGLRTKSMDEKVSDSAAHLEFYQRARSCDLAPLWKVLAGLVPTAPQPRAIPYRWRFGDVRPFLIEASGLISAEEAERRVLILENPGLQGTSRIADSLFGGLQIIMPGETAPAHRHVASALRFIIEGKDAYTAVDGERAMMLPGDFVVTPSWVWHDHANIGTGPMIWLDGLDMHMVNLLNGNFREEGNSLRHSISRPNDSSTLEFGNGVAPLNYTQKSSSSPIINYPYVRTLAALRSLEIHAPIDPCLGHIVKYLNPTNGDWAISTLATCMRLLPAGFETAPYRSTDATVFTVVSGEGVSAIGGQEFDWQAGDVFIAPSWATQVHQTRRESVLFTYSDRAVQEKLSLWREHRGRVAGQ